MMDRLVRYAPCNEEGAADVKGNARRTTRGDVDPRSMAHTHTCIHAYIHGYIYTHIHTCIVHTHVHAYICITNWNCCSGIIFAVHHREAWYVFTSLESTFTSDAGLGTSEAPHMHIQLYTDTYVLDALASTYIYIYIHVHIHVYIRTLHVSHVYVYVHIYVSVFSIHVLHTLNAQVALRCDAPGPLPPPTHFQSREHHTSMTGRLKDRIDAMSRSLGQVQDQIKHINAFLDPTGDGTGVRAFGDQVQSMLVAAEKMFLGNANEWWMRIEQSMENRAATFQKLADGASQAYKDLHAMVATEKFELHRLRMELDNLDSNITSCVDSALARFDTEANKYVAQSKRMEALAVELESGPPVLTHTVHRHDRAIQGLYRRLNIPCELEHDRCSELAVLRHEVHTLAHNIAARDVVPEGPARGPIGMAQRAAALLRRPRSEPPRGWRPTSALTSTGTMSRASSVASLY